MQNLGGQTIFSPSDLVGFLACEHLTALERAAAVLVPFSADRVVCLSDGSAYRRVGDTTKQLNPQEIEELRFTRGERVFELEPSVPFAEEAIDRDLGQALLDESVKLHLAASAFEMEAAGPLQVRRVQWRSRRTSGGTARSRALGEQTTQQPGRGICRSSAAPACCAGWHLRCSAQGLVDGRLRLVECHVRASFAGN